MNYLSKLFVLACMITACSVGCSETEYTASSENETGTISFQVDWAGASGMPENTVSPVRALDCAKDGIEEVTFEILDENDNYLAGETWPCTDKQGTVRGVPPGSNRTLIVEGEDAQNRIRYRGAVTEITVVGGKDTPVGAVVCDPVTIIESAYVQYRAYEDGTSGYRGWIGFTRNRGPIEASDVAEITLKDPDGNPVFLSAKSFWSNSYYTGEWNESASAVDFSGPVAESGFLVSFPEAAALSAGWYTYEVTTDPEDLLTTPVNFPGETILPTIKEIDMNYEWLDNGDLNLTWINPAGDYDQLRVVLYDQNWSDLLNVKVPPTLATLTIPAEQIQKIIDLKNPDSVTWVVQTRAYTETSDVSNYARGISNSVPLAIYGVNGFAVRVPEDSPAIQEAIDAAAGGRTVLVADGTYSIPDPDGFDFKGKAITVRSKNGPENCTINAGGNGRGFYFHSGEQATSILSGFTITNGVIDGWSTGGGGILCEGASPTIQNCIIRNNRVEAIAFGGGGISCVFAASPTIVNCIVDGNIALDAGGGGGIYCDNASPTIRNCTVVNNFAGMDPGGGIYGCGPSTFISNSIFWNNSPNQIDGSFASPDVTYSCIQGGFSGMGNIDGDPIFVSAGVYSLDAESPCIDTGTAFDAPGSDITGRARPQGSGYDMGAYEYQ